MSFTTMVKILSIARLFLKCQQNTTNGTNICYLNIACLFHPDKFFFFFFCFFQVKHFRALQEQARTYLDLLCTMCDLSNSSVKTTAKDIQQTEQMVKVKKWHWIYLTIFSCLNVRWEKIFLLGVFLLQCSYKHYNKYVLNFS